MDKWNQEHPDQEVHPGDRFSEARRVGEGGGQGGEVLEKHSVR